MLETGKSYTQEIIVGPKDTALAHGSGHLEVFATPAMVGLMENTAIHCLEGMLEPDTDTDVQSDDRRNRWPPDTF